MADFTQILSTLDNYMAITVLPIMIAILSNRNVKQYKEAKSWNWVRTFLGAAILADFIQSFIKFLYRNTGAGSFIAPIMTADANGYAPIDFYRGFIVMFGVMMIAYMNRLDSFLLFSVFYQIGSIVIYYVLGRYEFQEYFVMIFGALAILGVYETSIRVKDNNGLGFAVFYTLQFMTVFNIGIIATFCSVAGYIFGIILALGLFRPFGKEDF